MNSTSQARLAIFVFLSVVLVFYAISPASSAHEDTMPRFAAFDVDSPPALTTIPKRSTNKQQLPQQQEEERTPDAPEETAEPHQPDNNAAEQQPHHKADTTSLFVPLRVHEPYASLVAPVEHSIFHDDRKECPRDRVTSRTQPTFTQCTHGMNDVVSSFIHRDGYWRDCLPLAHLGHFVRRFSKTQVHDEGDAAVFTAMDVGGNIGSCAMLLASQGFQVVAFEPVKRNYEAFHSSAFLSGYDQKKLALVRAAATDSHSNSTEISIEGGNHGNSIVLAKEQQRAMPHMVTETISLVRIDELVKLAEQKQPQQHVHVHVWKLDCQGMELPALRGAKTLLLAQRVDAMFIEFDTGMTRLAGYNIVDLMQFLDSINYAMFYEYEKVVRRVQKENFESFASLCNAALDVVVLSNNFLESVGQRAVEKLMEYPKDRLAEWFIQSDRNRIPGVDY